MAWSRLQSASATSSEGGLSGTVAATFGTNLTAGSKIIAAVAVNAATGGVDEVISVKDGAGNSLTELASNSGGAGGGWTELWAMDTPAGDAGTKPTITATLGAVADSYGATILIQEVSGLATGNTTAMLDGTAGVNHGSSTGPATSGSYSSTASSEYLVAVYGDVGNGVTVTDSSGYSADPNEVNASNNATLLVNYKNSGNTSESASFTLGGTAEWSVLLVAFKLGGPVITSGPLLGLQGLVQAPAVVASVSGWRNAGHSR